MDLLRNLKSARDEYERAFSADARMLDDIDVLSDRDLELSGHVYIANRGNRRMQITVDDDSVPSAFLKRTGIDDEVSLLQVILNSRDLKTSSCASLLRLWLFDNMREEKLPQKLGELGF